MDLFGQTILNGLVLGGVYALAAVGFSLVFGVLGLVNLTHGAFIILGAYCALLLWEYLSLDPIIAILPIGCGMFLIGYAYQRTIISWAMRRANIVASLVVTFGIALIAKNVMLLVFSPDVRSISPWYSLASISLGDLRIDVARLVALTVSAALLAALTIVLSRTHYGRAIRATAQQPLAAELSGLNVQHLHGITFGLGTALAGASGAIIGVVQPFSPASEIQWTLNAFVVVVLGGVGSPAGALIGGVLIGLISALTSQYIAPSLTNAMMFLIMILMLLLRPSGILGHAFGESR